MFSILRKSLFVVSLSIVTLEVAIADKHNDSMISQARDVASMVLLTWKNTFIAALRDEENSEGKAEKEPVSPVRAWHKAWIVPQEASQFSGWAVKFTSLKLRNPKNQPDDWEAKVLKDFEVRHQSGESTDKLEFSEVFANGDRKEFRYIKAIPTTEMCLACHGTEINPSLKTDIKQIYPQDNATGYKVGDLRGAIVMRKVI